MKPPSERDRAAAIVAAKQRGGEPEKRRRIHDNRAIRDEVIAATPPRTYLDPPPSWIGRKEEA